MSRRRALRDFYAIGEEPQPEEAEQDLIQDEGSASEWLRQLDLPGFDVDSWTRALLSQEGAAGVLRVHRALARQSRALDSEQKALVYNNYRKMTRASEALSALASDGAIDALAAMKEPLTELAAALNLERPAVQSN